MKKNIIAIIAAIPFFSVYLHHYISAPPGMVPTGFVFYDMAYYSANGREIFEAGGNGWAYANPYDAGSPILYFHWLPWLLGFGIKILHIDPGLQFIVFGLIFGMLMTRLTYTVVERVLPGKDFRDLLFLLVMWGGGILSLTALVMNLARGDSLWENLLRFDPDQGLWFLNWGRNLIFSTEALYHSLVAGIWLSLLKSKWGYATLGGLALAATHPFSGIQFLLIITTYMLFLMVTRRQAIKLIYPGALGVGTLAFLGYYFVFLPSFASHRATQETWDLAWILPFSTMVLAYLPVGIFAAKTMLVKRGNLNDTDWLFIISFFVSFLLAKHDLFTTPRQPIHFTRGYLWTPLALLALPTLQSIFINLKQSTNKVIFPGLLTLILVIFASDNLTFLYTNWSPQGKFDVYLAREEREMYTWLDEQEVTGVLLYPNSELSNYLSATFTETSPYLGHWSLTPGYRQRAKQVELWMHASGTSDWMKDVDYLLVQENTLPSNFEPGNWQRVRQTKDLILFRQVDTE